MKYSKEWLKKCNKKEFDEFIETKYGIQFVIGVILLMLCIFSFITLGIYEIIK